MEKIYKHHSCKELLKAEKLLKNLKILPVATKLNKSNNSYHRLPIYTQTLFSQL